MCGVHEEVHINLGGDNLHLADVNADGTADLVQVRFDDVDIWLNRGGYGWTDRYTIPSTPEHPGFVNRIRFADLNASGSEILTAIRAPNDISQMGHGIFCRLV